MASLIHIIPDIHIRGKILTSSSPVANTPLCFRLIIKLEKWEYKACFVFVFFIFLPEVKRPLLQKSTIIVNCLYITPQQTTNTCLNKQNIALNLSLCLHQELVCFFFLSQCRLFILKLQMPSQGYSKLQAMLNLSSLCKKKRKKKSISEKVSHSHLLWHLKVGLNRCCIATGLQVICQSSQVFCMLFSVP